MTKSLVAGLALLTLATIAQAADSGAPQPGPQAGGPPGGMRMNPEERFKALDTNSDGKLSLAEFLAARPMRGGTGGPPNGAQAGGQPGGPGMMMPNREERFKALDANKDGFVSLEEMKAGMADMRAGMRGRDGERPGKDSK